MLSIYASNGAAVEENTLRKYLDVIVKDKTKMAIKTAAIVYDNGTVAAATNKFRISPEDFNAVKRSFKSQTSETISLNGVTFCVKSQTPSQLIAFNGSNYLIISKTDVTFIIVTCSSRQFYTSLAAWINAVAKKLREKHS